MAEDLLPILYEKVAKLTSPLCEKGFRNCAQFAGRKYRCCERRYCEEAAKFAKEKYDIELMPTGNPELPFMGENGCIVAPHLRPTCAIHVCCYSIHVPSSQPNQSFAPEGYQELRDQILAEAKRQGKEPFPCQ